jgi:flagellar basal body-associated protein FliL
VNKKQELLKALILLFVGSIIGITAYSYRHQVFKIEKTTKNFMNGSAYSYTDCEIYSSVPGQYHVKMRFMIPVDDEEQKKSIDNNMARIKDFIFTNISNDTEMGTTLKRMNWNELKAILIDAINNNSNKPVETIYFQEALILDIR